MKRLLVALAVLAVVLIAAWPLIAVAKTSGGGRTTGNLGSLGERPAPAERAMRLADGDDDDDDDDDAGTLAILTATASVDAMPPVVLLTGIDFCDEPRVLAGNAGGTLDELIVFNAGSSFAQAGLQTTAPGTYRVSVSCPTGTDVIDLALGGAGPPGPPGPPGPAGPPGEDGVGGIPAGQSCPAGTVAIGFDIDGTLRCSQRPPLADACPCFTDEELATLHAIIVATTAQMPDESALQCTLIDDFIALDYGSYPASGDTPTEIHLFGRDDTCGEQTRVPGQGLIEQFVTPISPEEAAKCNAAIFTTGQTLGCF